MTSALIGAPDDVFVAPLRGRIGEGEHVLQESVSRQVGVVLSHDCIHRPPPPYVRRKIIERPIEAPEEEEEEEEEESHLY